MKSVDAKLFIKLSDLKQAAQFAVIDLLVSQRPDGTPQDKRKLTFQIKKCMRLAKEAWGLSNMRAKR